MSDRDPAQAMASGALDDVADPLAATIRSAADAITHCRERGLRLATAESLTGGLLAAAIVEVPGSSTVFRGGVVTYATDTKASVLGVDPGLLDHVVSEDVAAAMAERATGLFDADLGIGTTGVAGPEPLDDQPPGTAWIAVHLRARDGQPARTLTRRLAASGDRQEVRTAVTSAVWALLRDALADG